MKIRIFYTCVVLALTSLCIQSYGQEPEYEQTISISEWIEDMQNFNGWRYKLKNTFIRNIHDRGDTIFSHMEQEIIDGDTTIYEVFQVPDIDISHIPHIDIDNCKLDGMPLLNWRFNTMVLRKCNFAGWIFELNNCHFNKVIFRNCRSENGYIGINDCVIRDQIRCQESTFDHITTIEDNTFTSPKLGEAWVSEDAQEYNYIEFQESSFNKLTIRRNEFLNVVADTINFSNINLINISLDDSKINYLLLSHMNVQTVSLQNVEIARSFAVDSMVLTKFIRLKNLDFPLENTNVAWSNIGADKLCFQIDGRVNYFGKTEKELANGFHFNELLSIYQKLFSLYSTRGDKASANQCYVDLKNVETRRYKYIYEHNGNLTNYFNWKLNQFLKVFCDYGTSPVKSLIISLYVVLGFACFYFFFYSEWDRINRSFLIAKSKKLLTYFQSEQKMEDFYTDEHKDELESYQSFKNQIHESAGKIPFFMKFLMKPLYRISLIRHKVISWLYRRTEILSGKWEDLTRSRKVVVGSVVGVSLTVYLVYLVLTRSLNSLFLSINTFSTLGFGDIPVKGISRYIAILEGFLGWFLLSIFSVSLISQILQN